MPETSCDKLGNLHEALAESEAHDEALDLLRSLVARIDMNPVEREFEIILTGEIARMMALSISKVKSRKTAFDEKTACSVKMVAGARKQRDSLILPVRL